MSSAKEDGFTIIPNMILEYWIRVLSPTQFIVLMSIFRSRWSEMDSDKVRMVTGMQDVNRDIGMLIQLDLITFEPVNGSSDIYKINLEGLYNVVS